MLTPDERMKVRREVVERLNVADERAVREVAFNEIVAQDCVFRKRVVGELFKRVEVIKTLSDETP